MNLSDIPLDDIFGMDEDDLCELIAADAAARVKEGVFPELGRYTRRIPRSKLTLPVLDMAIRETVAAAVALGEERHEFVQSLLANYPELGEHIEAAMLLDDVLVSTRKAGEIAHEQIVGELPRDLGPHWRAGEARYQLIRRLGRGSQSLVYAAIDRSASVQGHAEVVAIKLVPCDRSVSFDIARREAFAAQRVRHPAVARVLDVGQTDDGHCYIAWEYLEGVTLEAWCARNGRSPHDVVDLLLPVGEALAVAHARGVAHRDINPRNIIVDASGNARLIDFGLAFDLLAEPARGRGAPGFCAPEQHHLVSEDASLADVYGFAATLYWAVSGRAPNGDTTETAIEHVSDPEWMGAPPCPGADARLSAVLRRALQPRPEDRYQTMGAFVEDLRRWLRHEPIPWLKEPLASRVALAYRRAPRVAGGITLGVVLSLLGGVLLTGAIMQGRANRLQAQLAQAQIRADTLEGVQTIASGFHLLLSRLDPRSPSSQKIALLLALNHLAAPSVFDEQLRSIAGDRAGAMMRARLRELDARGYGQSIEAILLASTLASMARDDPSIGDPDALLADVRARIERADLSDDPAFERVLAGLR